LAPDSVLPPGHRWSLLQALRRARGSRRRHNILNAEAVFGNGEIPGASRWAIQGGDRPALNRSPRRPSLSPWTSSSHAAFTWIMHRSLFAWWHGWRCQYRGACRAFKQSAPGGDYRLPPVRYRSFRFASMCLANSLDDASQRTKVALFDTCRRLFCN